MKVKYRIRATPDSLWNYAVERRTFFGYWKEVRKYDYKSHAEAYLKIISEASYYTADGRPL